MRTRIILLSITVALALGSSASHSIEGCKCVTETIQQDVITDGLEVSLKTADASATAIEVTLRNVGSRHFLIELGELVANGRIQEPQALTMLFRDPSGTTRECHFLSGPVAGRIDPCYVPMPVGTSYTLRFSLRDFLCLPAEPYFIEYQPGENLLTARYTSPAERLSPFAVAIGYDYFWHGSVDSNTLAIAR